MNTSTLTSFRFFAAFIVVIFHYGRGTEVASLAKGFLTAGPQMVTFFFVLSGFVMTVAYLNRPNFSLGDYFASRVARIIPVYFLALSVSAFLYYSPTHYRDNIKALILNMAFLQSWFPPYPLSINAPAWSLCVEAFFYICFPVILIFLCRVRPKISTVIVSAIALYIITQFVLINLLNTDFYKGFPSFSHDLVYYFPLSHFCSFILGVSGAYFCLKSSVYKKISSPLFWSAGSMTLMFLVFKLLDGGTLGMVGGYKTPTGSSFYAPIFLTLILFSVHEKNATSILFSSKPLIFLGQASYALYILQKPAHTIFMRYINPFFGFGKDMSFYVFSVTLIGVSIAIYYIFEIPAKKALLSVWKTLQSKPWPSMAKKATDAAS